MKALGILVGSLALVLAGGVTLARATPIPAGTPGTASSGGLFVPAVGPCPRSLGAARDVANRAPGLGARLLPAAARSGLACFYVSQGATAYQLVHASPFGSAVAGRFERALAELSTTPPRGIFSCPLALADAAILAFGYSTGPSVDLYYLDSGCRSVDNGHLRADEAGHPNFDLVFAPLVASLAPPGAIGP